MDQEITTQCQNRLMRKGQTEVVTIWINETSSISRSVWLAIKRRLQLKKVGYTGLRQKMDFIGPTTITGTFLSKKFK